MKNACRAHGAGVGLLAAGLIGLMSGAVRGQSSIDFVPALSGGQPYSIAYSATPDGQFVVGYAGSAPGPQAYRWNRQTGQMDALGFLGTAGWYKSKAYGISDDGSVVVGRSDTSDATHPLSGAFKWTAGAGITALPYATTTHELGPQGNAAVAVSADGATIVGRFESFATASDGTQYYPALMHEWCRWSASGVQLLPTTSSVAFAGVVTAVSGDGSVVAGYVGDGVQGTLLVDGATVVLGHLSGGTKAEPTAVSRDGTTVVGWADAADADGTARFHAFMWKQATGMVDLGRVQGVSGPSRAAGVSSGGSVVVGSQSGHCLLWDAAHGWRDLPTVLASQGVNLQGKVLREATWVSPDGAWIAGNADDPSGPMIRVGWIAHVVQR